MLIVILLGHGKERVLIYELMGIFLVQPTFQRQVSTHAFITNAIIIGTIPIIRPDVLQCTTTMDWTVFRLFTQGTTNGLPLCMGIV